jgi:hypothetical protein
MADDDGYNPNDVKLKASKLAAAVAAEAEADKDTEEVLNEFNFLTNPDGVDGGSSSKNAERGANSASAGQEEGRNIIKMP